MQHELEKKAVGRADAQRGQSGHFGKGENGHLKTQERIAQQHQVSHATIERDPQFTRAVNTIAANAGEDAKKAIRHAT
jgi:hypothetical protein